jgi:serine/threonine protein kinase
MVLLAGMANASGAAIDLLQRLLVFDASKRLTAEEALDHPYLRDLKTPIRDMKVETPLNSEFEFDQLTSPKMMPMRQMIYNEIMLYHDPSSALAQERGRGISRKPSFGSSSSRDNSVSPTYVGSSRSRGRQTQSYT